MPPPSERPEWLDDHDQLIRLDVEVRNLKEEVARSEERVLQAVRDANTSSVKDRADLWAGVNELRRNGGWRGKTVSIGIPTGAAALLAIVMQYILTGQLPQNTNTKGDFVLSPPAAAAAPAAGRHTPRAEP